MCIYTLKKIKTNKKKKFLKRGARLHRSNVPKLGISVGKDTTKTNKD